MTHTIGVLGASSVGCLVARYLVASGRDGGTDQQRGSESLVDVVRELEPGARAGAVGGRAQQVGETLLP